MLNLYFDLEGYALIAKQLGPLVEQDHYGLDRTKILTAPNLRRVYFTSDAKTEISLEFDQPMTWKDECKAWIELNGTAAPLTVGMASGNSITLQLTAPTDARSIAYVSGKRWDGRAEKLLYGTNGIAALAFCGVPIEPSALCRHHMIRDDTLNLRLLMKRLTANSEPRCM